jgi:glycosyltransferase involved in cell wall biosynthesis
VISVIIPTRNRRDLLEKTLRSIINCEKYGIDFEVIVIDNNSSDDTELLTLKYKEHINSLKYYKEMQPGLHSGRHRGMIESSGEILAYLDDDAEVEKGWLIGIEENFKDDDLVLLGGNNYPNWTHTPPKWLGRLWEEAKESTGYLGALSLIESDITNNMNARLVFGCNFIIRKSALKQIGGFHPDSLPEPLLSFRGDGETHVSNKIVELDMKVKFDSRVSIRHAVTKERMSPKYFRKRAFNQGVSNSYSDLRRGFTQSSRSNNRYKFMVLLRLSMHMVHQIFRRPTMSTWLIEINRITCFLSTQRGYKWHQNQYINSKELQLWVHRDNYFNTSELN